MPSKLDLAALVEEHQAGVWRYLRVLGCDRSLADDLTQETFLAVIAKPFELHSPAATAAYLRTVARHIFLAMLRRQGRIVPPEELVQREEAWQHYAGDGGSAYLDALETCMQSLDDRSRQALDMRYRDKASRHDIAKVLGLSYDGAKNLLHRAKQKLKDCIERRLGS